MNEEIKNDIDKLDGMVKLKGKCGYEFIGGCSDLRRLKQENAKLKESNESLLRQFSARMLVSGTEALFNIITAEFNYQIQRLKEENARLKSTVELIKEYLKSN